MVGCDLSWDSGEEHLGTVQDCKTYYGILKGATKGGEWKVHCLGNRCRREEGRGINEAGYMLFCLAMPCT